MSLHTFAVCAYKESPYLESCLYSLRQQSAGVKTNVIICTSTPNSHIAELASYFDFPLLINDAEPNIATDWNFAIECCDTPFVTIAHQDDVYCKTYASHAISALSASEQPLLFFSNYGELRDGRKIDSNGLLNAKRLLLHGMRKTSNWRDKKARRRALSLGSCICCPSVTFAVSNLPNPIFSKGMRSNLDWEAWERISKLDGDFIYDPEILMYHRIHEDSETSAAIKDSIRTEEDLAMFSKFWPAPIASLINKVYSMGQRYNG